MGSPGTEGGGDAKSAKGTLQCLTLRSPREARVHDEFESESDGLMKPENGYYHVTTRGSIIAPNDWASPVWRDE